MHRRQQSRFSALGSTKNSDTSRSLTLKDVDGGGEGLQGDLTNSWGLPWPTEPADRQCYDPLLSQDARSLAFNAPAGPCQDQDPDVTATSRSGEKPFPRIRQLVLGDLHARFLPPQLS